MAKRVNGPKAAEISFEGMSNDLAYFLGLWVAEGSFEESIGRMTITCGDPEVGDFLKSGAVCGLKFKSRAGRSDQWLINSYEFMELMRFLKMPLVKAPEKWIPEWVWQGKREWAMHFIAGMWDGDGYVCDLKKKAIGYTSASKTLASDLQLLLSNIGIVGRLTEHVTPPTDRVAVESIQYRLTISGPDIAVFRDNIHLRISRKQRNLEDQAVGTFSRRDTIPHIRSLLMALYNEAFLKGIKVKKYDIIPYKSDVEPTYRSLRNILELLSDLSDTTEYQDLAEIVSDGYYWDEITEITSGECETFDFTIPNTHSFWSNGFISHNTPKGYNNLYNVYMLGKNPQMTQWESWQFRTSESPFIPLAEIEMARSDMDPRSFEQEFNACFSNMVGRVYYAFDRETHVGNYPYNPELPIWVGQDFNVDPMSSVIIQPQKSGQIWIVDEIFLRNANTNDVCDELEKRYWKRQNEIVMYPDPAGTNRSSSRGESDFDILRERHFRKLKYRRQHPPVSRRVNTVNRQFCNAKGEHNMFIHHTCKNLIESLEQTLYKPNSKEVDKSLGTEHMADALGYPIELEYPTRKVNIMGVSI